MTHSSIRDSKFIRWGVLFLTSMTLFASYFFTDVLSPVEDSLLKVLHWDGEQYGFFAGQYSFLNIIGFMIIGGAILDRLGIRKTGFWFIWIMIIGAAIKFYAVTDYFNNGGFGYAFFNSFWTNYQPSVKLASLGFMIFGLGSEVAGITLTKVVVKWFKGKELALAMGVQVAFSRLGMGLTFLLSPWVVEQFGIPSLIVFGIALLTLGLLAFLVHSFLDVRLDAESNGSKSLDEDEEVFRWSDLPKVMGNRGFLYIALLCVLFYSCVFPFMKFSSNLMINKYGVDAVLAGQISFVLPFGTVLLTPLFGWFIDNRGKGATLMIFGSSLLVLVHLIFAFLPGYVWLAFAGMFLLGVAFSLVPSALWPSVPKIVPEQYLGSAYAAIFWVQNIGLWLFPMFIGTVREYFNPGVSQAIQEGKAVNFDYTYPMVMLVLVGLSAVVFSFLLKKTDKSKGYGLELPSA